MHALLLVFLAGCTSGLFGGPAADDKKSTKPCTKNSHHPGCATSDSDADTDSDSDTDTDTDTDTDADADADTDADTDADPGPGDTGEVPGTPTADHYARPDGDDEHCDGTADAPYPGSGTGLACAFATLGACVDATACGETCGVGAGELVQPDRISISSADVGGHRCTADAPKRIVGTGPGTTTVFLGSAGEVTGCVEQSNGKVWECAPPSGADVTNPVTLLQSTNAGITYVDDNVSKGTLTGYVKLTPASGTGIVIHTNQIAGADEDLAGAHVRGMATYDAASGKYWIRPANDGEELGGEVRVWAPSASSISSAHLFLDEARGIEIEGMTLVALQATAAIYAYGRSAATGGDHALRHLEIYGSQLKTYGSASGESSGQYMTGVLIEDVQVLNSYLRTENAGCSGTDDASRVCSGGTDDGRNEWADTQECQFNMMDSTIDGLTCFGSREGPSFVGTNLTVKNFRSHFHHNHGIKIDAYLDGATFENVWSYNQQEDLFLTNCVRDVSITHATLPEVLIHQGASAEWAGRCPWGDDGPQNIDVTNSILTNAWWTYKDVCDIYGAGSCPVNNRAADRDHDWDYNVYLPESEGNLVRWINEAGGGMPASQDFTDIADWVAWSDDPCTSCTRDPHSRQSTHGAEFVQYLDHDDVLPVAYSFDLQSSAQAVDAGSAAYATSTDIDGNPRTGTPDAGAWEH